MRISGLTAHIAPEIIKQTDKLKKSEKTSSSNAVRGTDSAEFSDDSKKLNAIKADINVVASRVDLVSDVRQERIDDVKSKIKDGYYNSEEFAGKLAEKMIKDFGLG